VLTDAAHVFILTRMFEAIADRPLTVTQKCLSQTRMMAAQQGRIHRQRAAQNRLRNRLIHQMSWLDSQWARVNCGHQITCASTSEVAPTASLAYHAVIRWADGETKEVSRHAGASTPDILLTDWRINRA